MSVEVVIPPHIHDVVVRTLKCKATPYYLLDGPSIDLSAISHREAWASKFKSTRSAYAYKVNPLREVTSRIRLQGFGAEVSSGSELDWALSDGFIAENICFNGPAKTASELEKALKVGVTIQVDGVDEMIRIISLMSAFVSSSKLLLRLAAGNEQSGYSRLGCTPEEFHRCLALARSAGVLIGGIHMHTGSNYPDTAWLAHTLCSAIPHIRELSRNNNCRPIVNIGGGFPSSTCNVTRETTPVHEFVAAAHMVLTAGEILPDEITLLTEPGRSLVEDYGYLVTSVVSRKDRGDRHLLTVDMGSNLIRSAKVWHHPVEIASDTSKIGEVHYEVYGHLCFELDRITKDLVGSGTLGPGDRLIIGCVGGYDLASANTWGRPRPQILMLDCNHITEISRDGRMSY